jgi:di/tricarboxylate transporter
VAIVGRTLHRAGRNELLMLLAVMIPVGAISAFINNTAAVALILPFVINAAASRNISPSRLLIPLSFASQFGGVCTLIGTSTNLVVDSVARSAGIKGFTMFEFARLGGIMFGAGVVFFVVIGRFLLPSRRGAKLVESYQLGEYITELRVMDGSPLVGKRIHESKLGASHDVTVLEIIRNKRQIWTPFNEPIQAGDILLVSAKVKDLMAVKSAAKVELEPEFKLKDETLQGEDVRLIEVMVAPNSRLVGRTLTGLSFRWRYDSIAMAIQQRGHVIREKLANVRLRLGDVMLLLCHTDTLPRLRAHEDFIVLHEVDQPARRARKAPLALFIIAAVVAMAAFKVLPIMVTALLGCLRW